MMPPAPVTPLAVVFDFDGVLVSTTGVWDRAYAALFTHWGRRLDRDDRRQLASLPLADLGPAVARLLGNPAPPHDLATHLFELIATNAGMPITVLAGAAELVGALDGHCALAVASNSPTSIVQQHLETVGLARFFAAIVGADEVARPKPAPDVYRRACSLLGVRPTSAVAIEDSDIGVTAAKAEGLFTVAICPPGALPADATFPALSDLDLWQLLGLAPPQSA